MTESKMYVSSSPKMREVLDVDVTVSPGIVFQFTIDYEAGDSIVEENDKILIVRHPRSLISKFLAEGETAESENVVIYKTHLLMVQKRKRQVRELTPEEQDDITKSIQEGQAIHGGKASVDTKFH